MSVRRRVLLATLLGVAVLGLVFAVMRPRAPGPMIMGSSMAAMPIYRPNFPVDPRMPVLDSQLPLRRDTSARQKRGAALRPWQQFD